MIQKSIDRITGAARAITTTMGEITVLAVAVVGVIMLIKSGESLKTGSSGFDSTTE